MTSRVFTSPPRAIRISPACTHTKHIELLFDLLYDINQHILQVPPTMYCQQCHFRQDLPTTWQPGGFRKLWLD